MTQTMNPGALRIYAHPDDEGTVVSMQHRLDSSIRLSPWENEYLSALAAYAPKERERRMAIYRQEQEAIKRKSKKRTRNSPADDEVTDSEPANTGVPTPSRAEGPPPPRLSDFRPK